MKDKLEQLFNEYKDKCNELIEQAEKESVEEIWTLGLGNPFEIVPYANELLGIASGRIMKQNGKPSKGRYCNYFNKEKKIIRTKYYAELFKSNNKWGTDENIYKYIDKDIIEYHFQGVVDNLCYTGLLRITFIQFFENKPLKSYQLKKDGEYTEEEYTYDNDKIVEINTHWLSGRFSGYSRKYKIIHENEAIKIISISKNGEKQIYPEK